VNGGLQIYVIWLLIVFKMKKIILLFLTFSGICSCFAQVNVNANDSVNAIHNTVTNILPLKIDSVIKEKPSMRLYPNPSRNKAEIEIKGFNPGYVKLQLMNTSGKLLREEKRLVLSGKEIITMMFSEKPGLYFLFVKQGKIILKNKMVIQ
jgi:hypothetical protein